jgi:ankyrin repeat protein
VARLLAQQTTEHRAARRVQAQVRARQGRKRFARQVVLVVWLQNLRRRKAAKKQAKALRLEKNNLSSVASERDALKAKLAAMEQSLVEEQARRVRDEEAAVAAAVAAATLAATTAAQAKAEADAAEHARELEATRAQQAAEQARAEAEAGEKEAAAAAASAATTNEAAEEERAREQAERERLTKAEAVAVAAAATATAAAVAASRAREDAEAKAAAQAQALQEQLALQEAKAREAEKRVAELEKSMAAAAAAQREQEEEAEASRAAAPARDAAVASVAGAAVASSVHARSEDEQQQLEILGEVASSHTERRASNDVVPTEASTSAPAMAAGGGAMGAATTTTGTAPVGEQIIETALSTEQQPRTGISTETAAAAAATAAAAAAAASAAALVALAETGGDPWEFSDPDGEWAGGDESPLHRAVASGDGTAVGTWLVRAAATPLMGASSSSSGEEDDDDEGGSESDEGGDNGLRSSVYDGRTIDDDDDHGDAYDGSADGWFVARTAFCLTAPAPNGRAAARRFPRPVEYSSAPASPLAGLEFQGLPDSPRSALGAGGSLTSATALTAAAAGDANGGLGGAMYVFAPLFQPPLVWRTCLGAALGCLDPDRRTALHTAAKSGRTAMVEGLLAAAAATTVADVVVAATALEVAVAKERAAARASAVKNNSGAAASSTSGSSSSSGDSDEVVALVAGPVWGHPWAVAAAAGAALGGGGSSLGLSPADRSALTGLPGLAVASCYAALADEKGDTALHAARHLGATRSLLNRGADPNLRNSDGQTPLHKAVRSLDAPLVSALLKRGADANVPELQPSPNWTPLHCACARPDAAALLKALFASPKQTYLRVEARDARGDTPLHVACRLGGALAALRASNSSNSSSGGSSGGAGIGGSRGRSGDGRQTQSLARSSSAARSNASSSSGGRLSRRATMMAAAGSVGDGGSSSSASTLEVEPRPSGKHRRRGTSQGRHGSSSSSGSGSGGSSSSGSNGLTNHGVPEPGSGVLRAVQLLLAHGANPNAQNTRGETPLLLLAQNRFLRDENANLAAAASGASSSPGRALGAAPGNGANIAPYSPSSPPRRPDGSSNSSTSAGSLVLHACALALLAAQADPNLTDVFGSPPLFAAVLANDAALAEALLSHGAELNFPQPQLQFAHAQRNANAAPAHAAALLLASGLASGFGNGALRMAQSASRTAIAAAAGGTGASGSQAARALATAGGRDSPPPPPAPPPFAALPSVPTSKAAMDAPAVAVESFFGFFGLDAPSFDGVLSMGNSNSDQAGNSNSFSFGSSSMPRPEPAAAAAALPPVLVYELVPNTGFLRAMLRALVRESSKRYIEIQARVVPQSMVLIWIYLFKLNLCCC